jgi:hypothetical protein
VDEKPYPYWDIPWIATDRNGYVAAFITAGEGPIPEAGFKDGALSIEDAEAAILELPVVSEAKMLITEGDLSGFIALAQRGFFVYDWTDVHSAKAKLNNAYQPVAVPLTPQLLADVSPALREIAVPVEASFPELALIDPRADFACRERPPR